MARESRKHKVASLDPIKAYSDKAVREIIRASRPLPKTTIEVEIWSGDQHQKIAVSREAALRSRLVSAFYALSADQRRADKPSPRDQVKVFSEIELHARRLQMALQLENVSGVYALPVWLGPGALRAAAAMDQELIKRAGELQPRGIPEGALAGILVDEVVTSVRNLIRWSRFLRMRQDKRIDRAANRQSRSRNVGDRALAAWRERLADIWLEVFEQVDVESRAFGNFVAAAGKPIGLALSPDAERKRVSRELPAGKS